MSQPDKNGGTTTAPARTSFSKVLESSLANRRVARGLVTALGSHYVAAMIVATSTSQTTDFAALKAGDKVVVVPAAAGNSHFVTVATDGNLGEAAVIGSLYIAHRAQALDADQYLQPALV